MFGYNYRIKWVSDIEEGKSNVLKDP